jgi:hypothetical protein
VTANNSPVFSQDILLSIEPLPSRDLKLSVQAVTGHSYILQSSVDLTTWSDLIVTNPPSGSFSYTSGNQPVPAHFRVKVSP